MNYNSKVFLTTLFLAPSIFWLSLFVLKSGKSSDLYSIAPVLLTSIFVGFVLSIPTMLLFWIANEKLHNRASDIRRIKTILSLLATIGILATFLVVDKSLFNSFLSFLFPLSYLVVMVVSIWIFENKFDTKLKIE